MSTIPSPRGVLRTRWNTDPDFAGTYSFLRPGGTRADRERLSTAVAPGLWIAGEHASADYPGTMHGAYFSGLQTADRILSTDTSGPVVVLGAGIAGLACAGRLHEHGVPVRVFEAQPQIGGRVRVDRSLGVPVHLGAAWLHGTHTHPFAHASGMPSGWDNATMTVLHDDQRTQFTPAQLAELLDTLDAALDRIVATQRHDVALGTLADAVVASLRTADPARVMAAHHLLRVTHEYWYAAPLNELSARQHREPFRLPGPDLLVTEPLDAFIDDLAVGLDVTTRWRAQAITPRDTGWVVQSDTGRSARARHVVVTVPIASLHRRPLLPEIDRDAYAALRRIDAGPVTKLFLRFDTRWWGDADHLLITSTPDLTFGNWVDVSALAGAPVLCGFASGQTARTVETMPLTAASAAALRELAAVAVP